MSWFQRLFNQTFTYDDAGSDEEEKSVVESDESVAQPSRRRAGSRMPGQDMSKK